MNVKETLARYMMLCAPSGQEQEMAFAMQKDFLQYTSDVTLDNIGNVIAKFPGTNPKAPSIMVYGHMDSLGFVVRKIEPNGMLQIDRLGGIPEKVLPGTKITILNNRGEHVTGVIGTKSHHAASPEDKYKVDLITSLYVDLGAQNKEDVLQAGVHVGCFATYTPSFESLQGSRICGTAVDNRGACASLIHIASELSKRPAHADVYLVGTVWEEFNLRGAMIAARAIAPKIAISLDVMLTGDTPDLAHRYDTKLSAGPTVSYYSFHGRGTLNGTLGHKKLIDHALRIALEQQIPLQQFAALGILTDSAYVQLEGEGIASLELGFPARYTHSPLEVCDVEDIEKLGQLVNAFCHSIPEGFDYKRF